MQEASRRALYRIVYPISERPHFTVGRSTYEIIDLSELGIRYEMGFAKQLPALGTPIEGVITFLRGREIEIVGEVIRIRDSSVVLGLPAPGLGFQEVMAEQRWLRSRGYTLRDT